MKNLIFTCVDAKYQIFDIKPSKNIKFASYQKLI